MANFDPNKWYQLLAKSEGNAQSMDGSVLYDHGKGAVFFMITDTSKAEQQWQLFPYNSSFYVLRTKGSGFDSYLNVAASVNETTPGGTVPVMRNSTLSNDSIFWTISPWGDGTFFFTNGANGTEWHLNVKDNSLMAMSSNITAPQDGQRFSFSQIGTIDDTRFSSVNIPFSTAIPTSASPAPSSTAPSSTTSSSAATSSASSSQSGLSSGASAAIGATIGGVALIVAVIIGFVLLRRRKTRRPPGYSQQPMTPPKERYVLQRHDTHPMELHEMEAPPVELSGESQPSGFLRHQLG